MSQIAYPSPADKPVASIRDVTHRYGKVPSRSIDFSLDIPSGIMVGIIGPDGVGKSTLMALIAGSKKLQEGTVDVLGGDMRQVRHRRTVCPRIAYMPQGLGKNLYLELSVYDNVDFMAQLFGLSPERASAPRQGTARGHRTWALSPIGPPGKLSGGMKQKVGLCGALGPRSGSPHSRRADHRRRSAFAAPVLDAHRRHSQGTRPSMSVVDRDRLHGRGAAVGLDRRDGRGKSPRDRHAGRAHGAHQARRTWRSASSGCCRRKSAGATRSSSFRRSPRPTNRKSPSRRTA